MAIWHIGSNHSQDPFSTGIQPFYPLRKTPTPWLSTGELLLSPHLLSASHLGQLQQRKGSNFSHEGWLSEHELCV